MKFREGGSMKNATRIVSGLFLTVLTPLLLGAGNFEAEQTQPLFHHEHSAELLEDDAIFPKTLDGEEYASYIDRRLRELLPAPYRPTATRIASTLIGTANRYKMDPLFLMAVIQQESRFNPLALGGHGEIGLMQLKPTTAQWIMKKQFGEAPNLAEVAELLKDPASNIMIGALYLSHLRSKFENRSKLYISAYNMGSSRLRSKLREGAEPRVYRTKVLAGYVEFVGELTPAAKSTRKIAASKTFDL